MNRRYSRYFVPAISLLMILMVASLPFSINFYFKSFKAALIYPAEPMIGLIAIIFILQLTFRRQAFLFPDTKFLLHPVTCVVYLYLVSLIFSTVFSTMPLVSAKTLLIKSAYILVFYFIGHTLLLQKHARIMLWIKTYGISISVVVIYTLYQHSILKFTKASSGYVANPFFNDHTIYGAALTFLIPAFFCFFFMSKKFNPGTKSTVLFGVIFCLMLAGIYYSYCRAAWISFFAASTLLLVILSGFRFKGIMLVSLVLALFVLFNRGELIESFKKNRTDSNIKDAGLYEQLFSLTNVTNDLSNTERLNRWKCAVRMAKEKPFAGYGTGTFQFQYLPFQKPAEMTYISVKDPYHIMKGNGGSAHSEYFLTLAESGLPALISFACLGIAALYTALQIYQHNQEKRTRVYALILLFALVSYFIHGLFNNFLDNCKLAFLFWAALSALATFHTQQLRNKDRKSVNRYNFQKNVNLCKTDQIQV